MKVSAKVGISQDKYFVKLFPVTPINHVDADEIISPFDLLFTIDEYHRLLQENSDVLHSICSNGKAEDVYVFEIDYPVDITDYYNQNGDVLYTAFVFNNSYAQPRYLYGKKFGEKIDIWWNETH